jgi:hypothetical protein
MVKSVNTTHFHQEQFRPEERYPFMAETYSLVVDEYFVLTD